MSAQFEPPGRATMGEKADGPPNAKAPSESQIVMFQRIAALNCDADGSLDAGELLRWGDLATCAAAEAHCGTNCVTVAVSDMSFEECVTPCVGDTLELRATPVVAGNTSMSVSLLVFVESRKRRKRIAYCSALFTYVTMKVGDGARPRCPPLVYSSVQERCSATLVQTHKKMLQRETSDFMDEASPTSPTVCAKAKSIPMSQATINMVELVLPAHTNHMNNTFGGQVMAWMQKSAQVVALRHASKSGRPVSLCTRAVAAVEFPRPSKVADHLLFEATVQRVFPPNNMLVAVHVQKRTILQNSCIETINHGLFHIQAFETREGRQRDDYEDEEGGDSPVPLDVFPVHPDLGDDAAAHTFKKLAWRWELMAARSVMFGFRGGAMPLIKPLWEQAKVATIEGLIRLLPNEGTMDWELVTGVEDGFDIRMARDLWGQEQLAFKIAMTCPNVSADSAFSLLQDNARRPEWDGFCTEYKFVESIGDTADILTLSLRLPLEVLNARAGMGALIFLAKSAASRILAGSVPGMLHFPLFRCWRSYEGEHLIAARSVLHPSFPTDDSHNVRLPSGWAVQPLATGGCRITYVLQLENGSYKELCGSLENVEVVKQYCKSLSALHRLLDPSFAASAPRTPARGSRSGCP